MKRRSGRTNASRELTTKKKRRTLDRTEANTFRLDVNGWIFARVAGGPFQIGFQNGNLLANEIASAIEALKLLGECGYKRPWSFFCDTAMELFWPKLPSEYKDEIHGIAEGVRAGGVRSLRLQDIVALNGYFDSLSYHYWLKAKETGPRAHLVPAEHCSAFIATGDRTEDSGIVLAHNTWFQYLHGRRYNVILDVSPARGTRFVMQTMPGTIFSGIDWYVSRSGLVVAETTITGISTFNPEGVPCFLRARKAIQYAETIDEWVRIMVQANNGGYANDWLVGDTSTGEIAWLELGTFNHKLERTRNGVFIGSNLAMSDEVRAETTFDYDNRASTCTARHERLKQLTQPDGRKLNVESAKVLLADHYDSHAQSETPNRNTICGHVELDGRGLPEWEYGPNCPGGTFDGKVTDSALAKEGGFWAHWGKPCGATFNAESFLAAHPEYGWQRPRLEEIRAYPWTLFSAMPRPNPLAGRKSSRSRYPN